MTATREDTEMTVPAGYWPDPPDAAPTPAGRWLREHTTPWGERCPCGTCPEVTR